MLEPGVTAPIVGARTLKQFEDNLGALDVVLSTDQRTRLNAVSALDVGLPHDFLARDTTRKVTFGDLKLAVHSEEICAADSKIRLSTALE
ncbi:MAG: aldo/keto reductase [Sphingobium sp.]